MKRKKKKVSAVHSFYGGGRHTGRWDYKYSHNEWDYITKDSIELGRISLIGMLLKNYLRRNSSSSASILDVGCGFGTLLDHIPKKWETGYVGIDFSQEAIKAAKHKHVNFTGAQFINISVEAFHAVSTYDAIVFNEVLYYVNLTDVLPRYASYLTTTPPGYIITSNYLGMKSKNENQGLQLELKRHYRLVDEMVLTRPSDGLTFNIGSFQKKKI